MDYEFNEESFSEREQRFRNGEFIYDDAYFEQNPISADEAVKNAFFMSLVVNGDIACSISPRTLAVLVRHCEKLINEGVVRTEHVVKKSLEVIELYSQVFEGDGGEDGDPPMDGISDVCLAMHFSRGRGADSYRCYQGEAVFALAQFLSSRINSKFDQKILCRCGSSFCCCDCRDGDDYDHDHDYDEYGNQKLH